jgi:hypothetical protein
MTSNVKPEKGSSVTLGVAAACEIYARKLLGPAFKMVGYETLPTSSGKWNFLVTARHRATATSASPLDIVFSFVVTDEEAVKIIKDGFDSAYPVPSIVQRNLK